MLHSSLTKPTFFNDDSACCHSVWNANIPTNKNYVHWRVFGIAQLTDSLVEMSVMTTLHFHVSEKTNTVKVYSRFFHVRISRDFRGNEEISHYLHFGRINAHQSNGILDKNSFSLFHCSIDVNWAFEQFECHKLGAKECALSNSNIQMEVAFK